MKNTYFLASLTLLISITLSACTKNDEMPKANTQNPKPTNVTNENVNNKAVSNAAAKALEETKVTFSPEGLPKGWDFIDKDEDTVSDLKKEPGMMIWNVKAGKDYYGETQNAPRFLKSVKGDFEIETKVFFDPKNDYQGAGLLVFNDKKTFLRLERCFGGLSGGGSGVRFDKSENGDYVSVSSAEKNPTNDAETELKIKRVGIEFTTYFKPKGKDWKEISKISTPYNDEVDVGLIVCNTAAEISAKFAYINLKSASK